MTKNKDDSFVNEECSICHRKFKNIENIFVDNETDNYVCKKCAIKYDLHIVKCREYKEEL